jgi:hypothetical protein
MSKPETAVAPGLLEKLLLQEASGGVDPQLLLLTGTLVDTGRWWRKSPLWLSVFPGEVVLFAVGRRRYLERIPLAECRASSYNHASGQLVLAPAETLRFRHLRLKPSQALRFLSFLPHHRTSPNPNP